MLGTSGGGEIAMAGSSGDEKGGPTSSVGGGELYESDRGSTPGGGNRWPRQETIALLKIRSDMDASFRDSSLKGPLWEQVSRKMAELGYHRSGKKCKEKFENVYKYHKRTKDGRVAKADGKTYRFFDQLEAFDHQHQHQHQQHSGFPPMSLPQPPSEEGEEAVPVTMVMPASSIHHHITVTSSGTSPHPINIIHQPMNNPNPNPQSHVGAHAHAQAQAQAQAQGQARAQVRMPSSSRSASATPSSSSLSGSSPEDDHEEVTGHSRKRKRKWKDLFERMAKEVINKQEDLQRRFMEAVEKREQDRMAREEVWKMQELARLKREHETLVQERSMAAAKDAALISFLQKISEQKNIPLPLPLQSPPQQPVQPQVQIQKTPPQPPLPTTTVLHIQHQQQQQLPPTVVIQPPQQQQQQQQLQQGMAIVVAPPKTNGDHQQQQEGYPSSSRWPKAEVEALIKLRTNMDSKYQENGPKGPLWEEISGEMKKLGYNRNAKRCKEKWENINKYFKKVKDSNKKRRVDSKTCPYFDQLDALYREKNKLDSTTTPTAALGRAEAGAAPINAYGGVGLVQQQQPENPIQFGSDQDDHEESGEDHDDDEEEEEEEESGGYEIMANNAIASGSINSASAAAVTTTATTTATAK